MKSEKNGKIVQLLHKKQIYEAVAKEELFIDPLLDKGQIGAISVDLRLGYDFLVSIVTRKPSITLDMGESGWRSSSSYYQATRRAFGEPFILYPHQVVLGTTLEYIAMPDDIYADLLSRSSYNRLGIHINTMVQPGYKGCFPLELFNHGNNPIELIVGSRMVQARFIKIEQKYSYDTGDKRKYHASVRPVAPKPSEDKEIPRLISLCKNNTKT